MTDQPHLCFRVQTRRDMLRDLPAVVSQVIADTEFERVADGDDLWGNTGDPTNQPAAGSWEGDFGGEGHP